MSYDFTRGAALRVERYNERTQILERQTAQDFENYGPNSGMETSLGSELSFELRPEVYEGAGVMVVLHLDGASVALTAKEAAEVADMAKRWADAAKRVTEREAMLEEERASRFSARGGEVSGRELTIEANAAELQAHAAEIAWNRAIEADQEDRTGDRTLDAACGEAMRKALAARGIASVAWHRAADARRK